MIDHKNLPDDVVKRGLNMAQATTFMGKNITDLSRDELLAACAIGASLLNKRITETTP